MPEASPHLGGAIGLWGDDAVLVFVNEAKHLLALPVGPPDEPPPRRLAFIYGVAELRDGAAVSVPLYNDGFEALLFSIEVPPDDGEGVSK